MIRTEAAMGTVVSIEVDAPDEALGAAFAWFREVEACCSRFDAHSELRQLVVGERTEVSPLLFEAVRFALKVAEETGGAFDPTIGRRMAARGFDRHYATRQACGTPAAEEASWRDVELDATARTLLLRRPLTLDLGAVAKGLAVDAAARELQPFHNFCIDAGGDLYCGGESPRGEPWRIGIRHPRDRAAMIDQVELRDSAICTSGDYQRAGHIIDPRAGSLVPAVASATVIAPTAMLADALATAAFVLGAEQGLSLLERMGLEGLLVTPDLQCHRTRGLHA